MTGSNEGPLYAETNDVTGERWYPHPIRKGPDGEPLRLLSVTTALNAIDKAALKYWASQGTARLAMDELPRLIRAARREGCGRTRSKQACQECRPCTEYWLSLWHYRESERAKRRGQRVHKYLELWIRDGYWPQIEPQDQPYADSIKAWVADYGLTGASWVLSECTVIDLAYGIAGTLDGVIKVEPVTPLAAELCAKLGKPDQPVLVLDDLKTREKPGPQLYPESALQMAGYRHAPLILLPDGTEVPMVDTDGAIVVQARPDGYTCRPTDTSELTHRAFLSAMWVYRWMTECGDQAVQVGSFPLPTGWDPQVYDELPRGRPRRTAKKAPAKASPAKRAAPKKAAAAKNTPPAAAPAGGNGRTSTAASVLGLPRSNKAGETLRDEDIPF